MKQNPATGRFLTLSISLLTSIHGLTGCGRLPRNYSSDTRSVEASNSATNAAAINLNAASAAELDDLPGVGATLASRIITFRNEHGPFRRAEHLMMVRGISDRKFRELRSLIKVE